MIDRRLCFGAYRLNRAFNRFYQRIFADSGLTYPKFIILSALNEHGPMSVSELSNRAGVEPNSLSPLLKKMAEYGVLSREREADDERRVTISLTEMGQKALRDVEAVVNQGFAELGLNEEDVSQTLAYLDDVRTRLDMANPPKI